MNGHPEFKRSFSGYLTGKMKKFHSVEGIFFHTEGRNGGNSCLPYYEHWEAVKFRVVSYATFFFTKGKAIFIDWRP